MNHSRKTRVRVGTALKWASNWKRLTTMISSSIRLILLLKLTRIYVWCWLKCLQAWKLAIRRRSILCYKPCQPKFSITIVASSTSKICRKRREFISRWLAWRWVMRWKRSRANTKLIMKRVGKWVRLVTKNNSPIICSREKGRKVRWNWSWEKRENWAQSCKIYTKK